MMNNYDFNVIEEKTLSRVNGARSEFSGGGDDGGAFGLWELMGNFGK